MLLLIVAIFAAPVLVALGLKASGWRPIGTKQYGALLAPPVDFNAVAATPPLAWANTEGKWRVVLKAPTPCGEPCVAMVDTLQRVWLGLGRKAARVDVVYAGTPEPATRERLAQFPQARVVMLAGDPLPPPGLAVHAIDPHGYWVLSYAAGFAPKGLTKDLERLLR
jgi:hypothetical protein